MGPDGVWPAASKPAGLRDHKSEPSTTHAWLSTPHPSGFARHLPHFVEKGACNRLIFGPLVFECEVDELIERRLHAIVIGRVRRVFAGSGPGALVSWRGSYDPVGWSSDEIARAVGLSPRAAALRQALPPPAPIPSGPNSTIQPSNRVK